jgi:ABC-type lipoprotein export system ATPase subunit
MPKDPIVILMSYNEILELTVLAGKDRQGKEENFDRIDIYPGDVISIVGPTGSGKTAFVNDIEVFALKDTVTGRTILVNGKEPPEDMVRDPSKKPIAQITQNTRVISDLNVLDFLRLHIRARENGEERLIEDTICLANEFTGEKISYHMRMAELSGGQTRSLLIADAIIIDKTPVILLDEVENAGINKEKVVSCLRKYNKAVIFSTHDPYLALIADKRIVMRNGAVTAVITPKEAEKEIVEKVSEIDLFLLDLREKIRYGESFEKEKQERVKSGTEAYT